MDANQFIYWLKGITDTTAVPGPDTWAKIARRIDEVLAASKPKPPVGAIPRSRAADLDEAKRQMKEAHNRLVKGQYEEAARKDFVPTYPETPITYPNIIAGVQKND